MSTSQQQFTKKEIIADQITPVAAFQALTKMGKKGALLESLKKDKNTGEHSFIGFDPVCTFSSQGNKITILEKGEKKEFTGNPLEVLRDLRKKYLTDLDLPSTFMGGAIGFASYDAIRLFENIPDRHENEDGVPDLFFHFYEGILVFDHTRKKMTLIYLGDEENVDGILDGIRSFSPAFPKMEKTPLNFQTDLDDEAYKKLVIKAKDYIVKGDIFQVVLSRRFQKDFSGNPFDIYRALSIVNPSPYMFYFDAGDYQIAGASPEQLVSLQEGKITSMPIAGTKPRGKTEEEDEELASLLKKDEKEVAEHMMLIDLARNDVGAVAKAGTVQVEDLLDIKKFSHVMHIESKVTGDIEDGKDAFDVLAKTFPAGTLSGAPKIRAMEIIDELENSRRNLYGGGIITFDAAGNLNSCITIRTAFLKDGVVTVRAGGGIVYDSDPQTEADESRNKAMAVLKAVELAEGGLV